MKKEQNCDLENTSIWTYFTPWLDPERGLVSLFGSHFLTHFDGNFHGNYFENLKKWKCHLESSYQCVLKNGIQINLLDKFKYAYL